MTKYTVKVDGMRCGMCESHINDAVRRALPVRKVQASHKKGEVAVVAEAGAAEAIRAAINAAGYPVLSIEAGPWEKRGLLAAFRK